VDEDPAPNEKPPVAGAGVAAELFEPKANGCEFSPLFDDPKVVDVLGATLELLPNENDGAGAELVVDVLLTGAELLPNENDGAGAGLVVDVLSTGAELLPNENDGAGAELVTDELTVLKALGAATGIELVSLPEVNAGLINEFVAADSLLLLSEEEPNANTGLVTDDSVSPFSFCFALALPKLKDDPTVALLFV